MKNIAIDIKNVSIGYRNINQFSIHQLFGKAKEEKADPYFYAIKDVSFTVEQGEIIGIIGKNGSGKTTLLRAIAGIFQPNSGKIETYENRVSLMAIGVGFKPDITGRENILSSGMLMGFDERYIYSKLEEIIEFSELGDFIDKPVRTYSSGMYSKLSFAITAILDTDIMLIDEILSVGDEKFKKKSSSKMLELMKQEDKTVLIVTHGMDMLKDLCTRVIWINDGVIMQEGEPDEVIQQYLKYMS